MLDDCGEVGPVLGLALRLRLDRVPRQLDSLECRILDSRPTDGLRVICLAVFGPLVLNWNREPHRYGPSDLGATGEIPRIPRR